MHLDIRVVAEGGNDLHKKFISNVVNYGRAMANLVGANSQDKYVYIERDKPFNGTVLAEQEICMQDLLTGYAYTDGESGVRILAQEFDVGGRKLKSENNTSFRPIRYCLEEKQLDGSYLYQEFIYKTTSRKEDITLGFLNDFTSLVKGSTPSFYLGSTSDSTYLKSLISNQIRLAGYDRHLDLLGFSVTQNQKEYTYHMNNLTCDLTELEERLVKEGYYLFESHLNRKSCLIVVKNTFYGVIKLRTTAQ